MLQVQNTKLTGVKTIDTGQRFEDFRGNYVETYNAKAYEEAGITTNWLQDDYAFNRKHVLRGIHGDPLTEKLIYCSYGNIYAVVIQCDPDAPNYLEWQSFNLSDTNKIQVFVPAYYGIAYLVMSEKAIFNYKQSTYYGDAQQFTMQWNEPKADIWWPIKNPITSERDRGI